MLKTFTQSFLLTILLTTVATVTYCQTVITQWNFNSVPPDASTTTGSTTPSTGSGTITNIGGVTATFASGAANGDSSYPATTDNTGWGVTTWPAQGINNKTDGIHFNVSTVGNTNIIVSFDLRHSNTGPRHAQLQYTTDATATIPVWVDFAVGAATGGDTWFPRSYDLSAVTALNNNPNAGFQVKQTVLTNSITIPNAVANSATDIIIVTHKGVATNITTPVYVQFSAGSWKIYTENGSNIFVNEEFNVLVIKQ